ncbi:MAG: serine hydrolase [Bacteroidota bacterium]
MPRSSPFLVLLLAVCLSITATAQDASSLSPDLASAIDAAVAEQMQDTHLPGVAVVVVKDGATVLQRGYGVADVATGRAVDPEQTLFRIGSVSKALTALAVTRLIDDGRLTRDTDVSTYVDGVANLSSSDAPVTIEHLLTHTAGFDQVGVGRHVWDLDESLAARKAKRPSLEAFLENGNLRRVSAPGAVFRYDTYGITLAGHVLAGATDRSYAEAMQQELFAPLGMTRSFVEADDAHLTDLATGYGWQDSAYVAQPYEVYVTTPASSIDATPADLGRLLEALTSDGANAHGRLLSSAMAETVRAPQYRPHPQFTGITHGFWENPGPALPGGGRAHAIGHGGSMLGFWTSFTVFPDHGLGVLLVANRDVEAGGGPVRLADAIHPLLLDAYVEEVPPTPLPEPVAFEPSDLAPYVGDYAFGAFCRTCSRDEFARGAWPLGRTRPIALTEDGLSFDDGTFLPTAERDVFVDPDGGRLLFFGRDADAQVAFFVTSDGPAAFERVHALEALREHLGYAEKLTEAGFLPKAEEVLATALNAALDAGVQNEFTINAMGYGLLEADALPMALAVFRFNATTYPGSWNAHDSLGEALALAGRRDEAIAAYERSLALNPQSETGRAALARLRAE